MADGLPWGRVKYSAMLQSLEATSSQVRVTIGEESSTYDYVVGCDGINSKVRQSQNINYVGIDLEESWSIADCEIVNWPGMSEMRLFTTSSTDVVVVLPIAKGRVRLVSNSARAIQALPVPMTIEKVHREGTFRVSVRQAERYQAGRVFLAGDAAHCHSPVGGRGMNLGIADAIDLAHRFAKGGLEEYTTSRHSMGAAGMAISERGRKLVTQGDTLKRRLVLNAMGLATRVPVINRRAATALLGGISSSGG